MGEGGQRDKSNQLMVLIAILFLLGLVGCGTSQSKNEQFCKPPYYEYKAGDCCLDKDQNSICDTDEKTTSNIKEGTPTSLPSTNQKAEAEKVAQLFLAHWERKEYGDLYDLILGSLIGLKTKEQFVRLMELWEPNKFINSLRYEDTVLENEDTAYVQYTIGSMLTEMKAPSINLKRVEGNWKVDAFANIFLSTCTDNKCQESEDAVSCPLDCFEKTESFELGKPETITFLDYKIRVEALEVPSADYQVNVSINDRGAKLKYKETYNPIANIYVQQMGYQYTSVSLRFFNKD